MIPLFRSRGLIFGGLVDRRLVADIIRGLHRWCAGQTLYYLKQGEVLEDCIYCDGRGNYDLVFVYIYKKKIT